MYLNARQHKAVNRLILTVKIFFTRTSGLAEADGSWRKLTEVLKIDENIENSMRNSLKILKNNLNL